MKNNASKRSPFTWIPTLYFIQGLPYVAVMSVAVILYKKLGLSNTDIALYTGWLYLPWVIKPLWSPLVDLLKTKRWWILTMQFFVAIAMAGVAFSIPTTFFIQSTLAFFWLMAFSSATHDIAADGFYMLALDEHEQAFFSGIRNTFYRIAMITGQGLLVILAGWLELSTGDIPKAWAMTFIVLVVVFLIFFFYHQFILPKPISDKPTGEAKKNISSFFDGFIETFVSFFKKKGVFSALFFFLTYRLAESQLVKLSSPFLLDGTDKGGLGLSTLEVGFVYGTVGIIALTIGGILGGFMVAKNGLKRWLWPMALMISLPNAVYLYMSYHTDISIIWVNTFVAIEQFGYGFGFMAYSLYMIYFAQGEHKTAHFSICTAFMAAGMMLPGMAAGWIEDKIGYQHFFIWVMVCTLVTFLSVALIKVPSDFGMKKKETLNQ